MPRLASKCVQLDSLGCQPRLTLLHQRVQLLDLPLRAGIGLVIENRRHQPAVFLVLLFDPGELGGRLAFGVGDVLRASRGGLRRLGVQSLVERATPVCMLG